VCAEAAAHRPKTEHTKKAWMEATERDRVCASCGKRKRLYGHHVVYVQHVRRSGGAVYDLRNRLSLCRECHDGHHHGGADVRVAQTMLRPENFAFANELLEAYGQDYLDRHYPREAVSREMKWLAH
jgi:hypothetical protein